MTRRPRFRRDSSDLGLRLTPRDVEILRQVSRHRFLNSRQIAVLVRGSSQQILRRLQRLYHHGYLDRPRAQVRYFSEDKMQPLVYGLGRAGTRVVADPEHPLPRLDNRNVKQVYLQHTLLVADVMVAFVQACRRKGAPRLIEEDELSADTRRADDFRWSATVARQSERRRVGVIPDRVFALESPTTGERVLYFVEADRSTMPVTRHSLNKSSLLRKLLSYEATWQQGVQREKFGCERFRVLIVTSGTKRIDSAVAACGELSRGRGLFLFTDADSLRASADALTHPWRNASGGTEPLTR